MRLKSSRFVKWESRVWKRSENAGPASIFLDVEMPGTSGFQMLEKLASHPFHIIFTTAYDQHALRAIRAGALDYLLKPVDKGHLRIAIDKVVRNQEQVSISQLTALLTQTSRNPDRSFQKIAFPTLHGFELISIPDIVVLREVAVTIPTFI